MKDQWLLKLEAKQSTLGVVGLGYVGLPLAVTMAKAGFTVVGIEQSQDRAAQVNAGHSYIKDVPGQSLAAQVKAGRIRAHTDFASMATCDAICIAVPTPLDVHQEPDLHFIRDTGEAVGRHLRAGQLVVLESTTYPGTTRELLLPLLEQGGLVCGQDFWLAFSPERVDPGNAKFHTGNTPKVVGGVTPDCTELAAALYEAVLEAPVHRVSSPDVAEMEKLLENTYRNVNIGLVNELAKLCEIMGIDIWEVIDAAATKPYGFQPFYPGPGLGGHCIPLDPAYLSWRAREYGFSTSMIEASMHINVSMPAYCVQRAMDLLNRDKKAINGANILMLGVAYKADIEDYRESPALEVLEQLHRVGAQVVYYDPHVPEMDCKDGSTLRSEPALTAKLLERADLVMIITAHRGVDYALVQRHAARVFDTRNAMRDVAERESITLL